MSRFVPLNAGWTDYAVEGFYYDHEAIVRGLDNVVTQLSMRESMLAQAPIDDTSILDVLDPEMPHYLVNRFRLTEFDIWVHRIHQHQSPLQFLGALAHDTSWGPGCWSS